MRELQPIVKELNFEEVKQETESKDEIVSDELFIEILYKGAGDGKNLDPPAPSGTLDC